MLEIQNIHAGYGELQILKDVSLTLKKGSISVLMGPNGAGKSTLLKSIFHLTNVIKGKVLFEGKDITKKASYELLDLGISFVSQGRVNFGTLTVDENLRLGAHHIKDQQKVETMLAKIYSQFPDLKKYQNSYAFSLSGGQQQMLAIGRALMIEPKLILMDEPSLGLSPKLVKEVFASIVEIKKAFNTTVLIVEHNIKSLLDVADYGYILVNGELVHEDTCKNLKTAPIMKKVFVGALE